MHDMHGIEKQIPLNVQSDDRIHSTQKPPFLIGFANSMFQSSGYFCGDTNWSTAADNGSVIPVESGQYISHWLNFEDDLDKMKELGLTSYRFSIEWSHIEPQKDAYDDAVIARYDEMIMACLSRNIKPMLTLYHFNEPLWFSKLGSFENESNIKYFVNFCEMLFNRYGKFVHYWCTMNEPEIQAFSSYLYGQFPPHKHSLKLTTKVMLNMLKAHVEVYKKLKKMPHGEESQIGIVHNVLRFIPRYKWEPVEYLCAKFFTALLDDLLVNFFKTGHFVFKKLFLVNVDYFDADAPNSYDFIGLNFYGRAVIGFNKKNIFGTTHFPDQVIGDFHLPIDPQGLANAIDELAQLNKPIIITETGFGTDDDKLRTECLNQYFKVINNKISENIDIRGVFIWTFADNYEWDRGHSIKFGLHDQFRVERISLNELRAFIKQVNNS